MKDDMINEVGSYPFPEEYSIMKKQYTAPQIAEIGRLNEVVNTQRDTFDYDGAPIIKGNMVLILLTFST
jgi:hypothetical protein